MQTWYVTAGQWPGEGSTSTTTTTTTTLETETVRRTQKVSLEPGKNGGFSHVFGRSSRGSMTATNGTYEAQIVKTTDGGATWTTVFPLVTGEYYFNGIDWCVDAMLR
jgi:hypothetical protein